MIKSENDKVISIRKSGKRLSAVTSTKKPAVYVHEVLNIPLKKHRKLSAKFVHYYELMSGFNKSEEGFDNKAEQLQIK